MTVQLPVREKDEYLRKLLSLISNGEEVIITEDDKPVARLVPIKNTPAKRVPGSAKGKIIIHPGFNDPLPDEILDDFES
ncbi:MAG: type II toxin-antitoxin system Phd/YefM family antitoxin [Anaerolineae bacterium]|nr:type II toxin-antitoxin system Phd/YefM family antitoxin [Anaerolineae bacterium]